VAARYFVPGNIQLSCPGITTTGRLQESVRVTTNATLPNKRMTRMRGQMDGRSPACNSFPGAARKIVKKWSSAGCWKQET
jgi:hypothetical protein